MNGEAIYLDLGNLQRMGGLVWGMLNLVPIKHPREDVE